MDKFMFALDKAIKDELDVIAFEKGITIQELIRAVIVPYYLRQREKGNTA